jgi:hypothetical protein
MNVHPPLPTHHLEDEINRNLSVQTGFSVSTVEYLRQEFKKLGRNPCDASIELLAIENGFDEHKVKVRWLTILYVTVVVLFSIYTICT